MSNSLLAALEASGASLFSHHERILSLRVAGADGIAVNALLPHRVQGEEALSRCYRYELQCLSADAFLELKELLGQSVELAICLANGSERHLSGLVTRAERLGADGGFARYGLTIEPALATLTLRRNSRAFQDLSVVDIVRAILDEHLAANPVFAKSFAIRTELTQTYPKRSYCLQYRESDLAFIERLLAEEGISYGFTHGKSGDAANREAPVHTLVLFDANHHLPRNLQGTIRFHGTDRPASEDAIDLWTTDRQIQAGQTRLASFDYKAVSVLDGDAATRTQHGEAGTSLSGSLEDYDPQTLYYGANPEEMARYATLRQRARDLAGKTFRGAGTVRGLTPGTWFALRDHPVHDQAAPETREFLVTGLRFEAENNLTPDAATALAGLLGTVSQRAGRPPYRNEFTAVRRDIPVVPDFHRERHRKPTAPGSTTATVVGPADEEIFTDEHGRIKIQFHWQRPQDHPQGGADRDDRSSTWVRVAMPSAGAGWGSQYIPRVGQEVVVTFLESDVDRPLITGVVFNGSHPPPTFSGAGSLPANKTLSGHKSKEYKGQRHNELLFDDTTGEIRTRLASEHGKTQLNQGFLVHPRRDGKGEPRGEGFELRSDHAGALRAGRGLLISAWQRLNASDGQLARDEVLGLMGECFELFKQLGDYAAQHQGQDIDPQPQADLRQAFSDWEQGSNTAREGSNGGAPVIGVSAPRGLYLSTPQCVVTYGGHNVDTVAQQHLQQTAGGRFSVNAGRGISLFAHGDGLRAIAHQGKLLLQSQHDDTEVNAQQSIKLTASAGKILGMAEGDIIFATSGGAYLKLSGPNIELGGPGDFIVKAAAHQWLGPASQATDLPSFGSGELGRQFRLVRPTDGQPIANAPYQVTLEDGRVIEGVTNAAGETDLLEGDRLARATVRFLS